MLKDATPDDRDKLIFKWTSSLGVFRTDFGDPLGTTDYLVCLYDGSVLKLSAMAPADGSCAGQPCWTDNGLGVVKYTDRDLTPDGLQKILLRSGGAGSAKISVKGLGANLGLPGPPLATPVKVQIQRSGASFCWEATFSTPSRNELGLFKAKSD